MLSQHACMSSMKIFIRKVKTFLSSGLSYRKEESTYFIVLTFTKCSTNTHASCPNRLGDGPSPSRQKQLEASGEQGSQVDSMASRQSGLLSEARTLSRLRQKREQDFPGTTSPGAGGRTSLCSFIPIGQAQIRKNWGKWAALGGTECQALSREASGEPLLGPRGGRPRTALAAGREPCSLEGEDTGRGTEGQLLPRPSLEQPRPSCGQRCSEAPRCAYLHLAHQWMKGTHMSLPPTPATRRAPTGAAAPGSLRVTPRDWGAFRPCVAAANSAESPGLVRSGAEVRTSPSCQLRQGSVLPEAPATGMPAPGPPASPAQPAPVCSEAELDRGWTQEGDSQVGAPAPVTARVCRPRHVRGHASGHRPGAHPAASATAQRDLPRPPGARSPNLLSPLKWGADTKHKRWLWAEELAVQGGPRASIPQSLDTPGAAQGAQPSGGTDRQLSWSLAGTPVPTFAAWPTSGPVGMPTAARWRQGGTCSAGRGTGPWPLRVTLEREGRADQVQKREPGNAAAKRGDKAEEEKASKWESRESTKLPGAQKLNRCTLIRDLIAPGNWTKLLIPNK